MIRNPTTQSSAPVHQYPPQATVLSRQVHAFAHRQIEIAGVVPCQSVAPRQVQDRSQSLAQARVHNGYGQLTQQGDKKRAVSATCKRW